MLHLYEGRESSQKHPTGIALIAAIQVYPPGTLIPILLHSYIDFLIRISYELVGVCMDCEYTYEPQWRSVDDFRRLVTAASRKGTLGSVGWQ